MAPQDRIKKKRKKEEKKEEREKGKRKKEENQVPLSSPFPAIPSLVPLLKRTKNMKERKNSAAAFEQAKQIIPGGVNSPVRALKSVGTTPLFVRDAKGPYIYDIDDNKFIDFCMSWGVFILGHNNDKVSKAASDAIFH